MIGFKEPKILSDSSLVTKWLNNFMKIVITSLTYPEGSGQGGAEEQCYVLSKYLAQRGHEVHFMALRGEAVGKETRKENFYLYTINSTGGGVFTSFYRIFRYLKKTKPDVWYVRYFRDLVLYFVIAKFLGIPLVLNTTHIDNCYPTKRIPSEKGLLFFLRSSIVKIKQFLNFQCLKFIKIITINQSHVAILRAQKINAQCIYNSVEDYSKGVRDEIKKRIVMVGNIKSRKRPELFIELAKVFKNSGYEFLLIGNLHDRSYSEMLQKAQKEIPGFNYVGGKTFEAMDKIVNESLFMVNPCEPEGFGCNFIHAWLNGCPTITLEFDPDGIIEREKIGFRSGNFEQLVKDVKYLMENPDACQDMGKKARFWALSNHQMAINGPKYEKFFTDIYDAKNK